MLLGDKTTAIFDIWSIEHLMAGVVLTFVLNKFFPNRRSNLILLLFLSCFWECLEHYLEEGLLGIKIKDWFAGTEYWGNRLIGDNVMIILGYIIQTKFPKTIFCAVILSIIFLCIHLYLPSSMDLQKFLFLS